MAQSVSFLNLQLGSMEYCLARGKCLAIRYSFFIEEATQCCKLLKVCSTCCLILMIKNSDVLEGLLIIGF